MTGSVSFSGSVGLKQTPKKYEWPKMS